LTAGGDFKRFAAPNPDSRLFGIAVGPPGDSSIWFADNGANAIGKLKP
jgi:streptogramin lyase